MLEHVAGAVTHRRRCRCRQEPGSGNLRSGSPLVQKSGVVTHTGTERNVRHRESPIAKEVQQ